VAAHLAHSQLAPGPLAPGDGRHLSEMLDAIASALARVARLYAPDPATGKPRELVPDELEGARAQQGATRLVLRDGRALSDVSMMRSDLRLAIATLKSSGVQNIAPPSLQAPPAGAEGPRARLRSLAAQVAELEKLVAAQERDKARRLATTMARGSPHGPIANRAMQLVSALHDSDGVNPALARLRSAIDHLVDSA
jgi:hypothetical protein